MPPAGSAATSPTASNWASPALTIRRDLRTASVHGSPLPMSRASSHSGLGSLLDVRDNNDDDGGNDDDDAIMRGRVPSRTASSQHLAHDSTTDQTSPHMGGSSLSSRRGSQSPARVFDRTTMAHSPSPVRRLSPPFVVGAPVLLVGADTDESKEKKTGSAAAAMHKTAMDDARDPRWTIARATRWAIVSRLMVFLLLNVTRWWLAGDFDTSAEVQLKLEQHERSSGSSGSGASPTDMANMLNQLLVPYLRWDALYFQHIALHGYTAEQQYAFFPLLPTLVSMIASRMPTDSIGIPLHTWTLLLGVLLSNTAFVLATRQLYHLTLALLGRKRHRLAFTTCALFTLHPATAFLSAFYTESLFAMLSFAGMRAFAEGRVLRSAVWWMLGTWTRSNGALHAGFYVWMWWQQCVVGWRWTGGRVTGALMWTAKSLRLAVYAATVASGLFLFQYHAYQLFCKSTTTSITLFEITRRPWCDATPPLIYSFVQEHYWNNGFLRYYTLNNIPNFALALPMTIISIVAIAQYARHDWLAFLTLGWRRNIPLGSAETAPLASNRRLQPWIYLWAFQVVYAWLFMHVQVLTRFLTAMPCVLWFIAEWVSGSNGTRQQRAALAYFVVYGVVGVVLFSGFYPPA